MVQDVPAQSVSRVSLQHYVWENSAVLWSLIILIIHSVIMGVKQMFACGYSYVWPAATMRPGMAGACRSQTVRHISGGGSAPLNVTWKKMYFISDNVMGFAGASQHHQ